MITIIYSESVQKLFSKRQIKLKKAKKMSMVQVQAQISFDDLLRAALQLNPFERKKFAFRIMAQQTPVPPRHDSERLVNHDKALGSPEDHPFYQLLHQIMTDSAQLRAYASYIKEVFRYVSAHENTVISLSLAVDAISLIISLPDLDKYHLSIYVIEDSGLVLDFFRGQGRVFCILREQYAHIMGMLGDDMSEYLLQDNDYSINKTSTHLQELFKDVLGHQA